MPLRLCSILGTLVLALAVARPALADSPRPHAGASAELGAKKTKSKKDEGNQDEASDDDKGSSDASSEDLDTLMTKKGSKPAADTGAAAEGGSNAEQPPSGEIGDTWEKPPVEQEKALGPAPKPAEKPAGDGKHWSAGLVVGWAFKTDWRAGDLGADPYGLGMGLRGGYSFDFKLYTGVYFNYYLGSSQTGTSALLNVPAMKHAASYMQYGVEAGYDAWIGSIILRPSLQIGVAMALTDNSANGATTTVTRLMFGPGFTLIDPIGEFFIGADARALLVPSSNGVSAVFLGLTGGLRFD